MHQALHIFKKDVLHLKQEIVLMCLIAAVFAAIHAHLSVSDDSWWAELALVVTSSFLIGRVVLAEAIPGDRQFWITRPYRWKSLLAAKLLFVIAFVNLPILVADLFILIIDRFPIDASFSGLLWSQALLFTFIALPFAALAALSSGMATYIFAQLILLATAFGIWELFGPPTAGRLGGAAWVRGSIGLIALGAVAATVFLLQYKSRRTTLSRWLGAGGLTFGAIAFIATPWPFALKLLSHSPTQAGLPLTISLEAPSAEPLWLAAARPNDVLHLPIRIQGIPRGAEIQPDALAVRLESSDGRVKSLGVSDCGELRRSSISADAVSIFANCSADPAFFGGNHAAPLTLHATLYFTVFGNARSQTIPLSNQPVNTLDGLQCFTDTVKAQWDVYCRSAFRWPARLVYAKLGHTNAESFSQFVSYSPIPATLSIEPIETRWASAYAAGPEPIVPDVTIVVEEPLAHLRRDFEVREIHLEETVPPKVMGVVPQKSPIQ
jgi:hypothetical protein